MYVVLFSASSLPGRVFYEESWRPLLKTLVKFGVDFLIIDRSFKEKRGDREVERLFKILEYSTELKENQLDRTEQLGDCHLPSLKANVDVALSMCERVLQREQDFDIDKTLEDNRKIRKLEWEKFVNDMSEKCEKVNQTFEEKEDEIKEYYTDLEKKLHIA
ncbi:biogenesis of lysosome-related organelles complex 1 subunit 5 isoform X1 [Megalopta genalis]|uniref:biogenesis of lysosome-related organelles complex 1 subunit 5 isoform X1 n=1 Tax=Megalopta genalis TaxID=115081 RepID=UPI00144360BA|nr:biogenesis of lysosome-related organelles complex 1 subunit 5 isoform X1 [Megalopta genalis]